MLNKLQIPLRNKKGKLIATPPTTNICPKKPDPMDVEETTAPHNKPFVLEVLNSMQLDFQGQPPATTQTYLITADKLQNMAEKEQIQLAILLNDEENEELEEEYITVSGWSGLVPGGKVEQYMLTAANWAMKWGGRIGETKRSYTNWHQCWQNMCESRGAISQLDFEEQDTDLWQWLNNELYEAYKKKKSTNIRVDIGGNSGLRCWFLSILYLLIGEKKIMQLLKQQQHQSDGHTLLYKILQSLKLGITQQKETALTVITQFIEALLQGHYCYWQDYGCLETGFKILQRMAPNFFDNFAVRFQVFSKCPVHKKYAKKKFNALRMEFCYKTKWHDKTGYLSYKQPKYYQCFKETDQTKICPTNTNVRMCKVLTPRSKSFLLHFEKGIPATLWKQIHTGHGIYFGEQMRTVGGAIFRENGNHFVTAYLMVNHQEIKKNQIQPKVWFKLETLQRKILKYKPKAKECSIIFINPPEKSCFCGEYDDWFMVQCNKCFHWLHKECVNLQPDDDESVWDYTTCPICE